MGLAEIAHEALLRHAAGFEPTAAELDAATSDEDALDVGGVYFWRVGRRAAPLEPHDGRGPSARRSARGRQVVREYSRVINDQRDAPMTLRGCWDFVVRQAPVPLDEVEPAAKIVRRFSTGAMSFGSISQRSAREPGHRDEPHRR